MKTEQESAAGERTYTAFLGDQLVASGDVKTVVVETKRRLQAQAQAAPASAPVLIFEDQTGEQVDFDLRGSARQALARLSSHPLFASTEARGQLRLGPGRPKLGVVSREVSLLPRHWQWLDRQPGGVSAALRQLVEAARKRGHGQALARTARDAAGKFMWAMAGNFPHFEEASRALYAGDRPRLRKLVRRWPDDVRRHLDRLVGEAARLQRLARIEKQETAAPAARG